MPWNAERMPCIHYRMFWSNIASFSYPTPCPKTNGAQHVYSHLYVHQYTGCIRDLYRAIPHALHDDDGTAIHWITINHFHFSYEISIIHAEWASQLMKVCGHISRAYNTDVKNPAQYSTAYVLCTGYRVCVRVLSADNNCGWEQQPQLCK